MSYTNMGYAVYNGTKKLSRGYDTEAEALTALYRIAKTDGYTYETKGLFCNRWHKHKLPKKWKRLTIKTGSDYGSGATWRIVAEVSRDEIPPNAKPYAERSNIKHLRRPKALPRTITKDGEAFQFLEAYITQGEGLAVEYGNEHLINSIGKEWADKWKPYGLSKKKFREIEKANGYKGNARAKR